MGVLGVSGGVTLLSSPPLDWSEWSGASPTPNLDGIGGVATLFIHDIHHHEQSMHVHTLCRDNTYRAIRVWWKQTTPFKVVE